MASTIGTVMMKMAAPGSLGGSALNGPSGVSTGGADKKVKEQVSVLGDIRKHAADFNKNMAGQPRWWTKALKTMGIQMGIAGILKQSQIFTSTLGSLFQILGAFVDVMLAPWIPVIVPGLRKLADQVPRMRVAAQKFFEWATGSAWPWIQKIYTFLKNDLFDATWWMNRVKDGVNSVYVGARDWVSDKLWHVWDGAPPWLRLGENPFTQSVNVIKPAIEKLNPSEGFNKVETSIGILAGVWATAKTLRYGLQATRWLPFINAITEPIRLVSKATDLLFNRTAQVLGRSIGGLTKALLEGLGLKKPPLPGGAPWDAVVDVGRRTPGSRPPGRIPPGRRGGTGGTGGRGGPPGGRGGVGAWDEGAGAFYGRGPGPGTGANVALGTEETVSKPNPRFKKAQEAYNKFSGWFWPNLKKLGTGGKGVKDLFATGYRLAGNMLTAAAGTPMARMAARIAGRFAKIIPFVGAAWMGAETTFELRQIAQSEKPWTGDITKAQAWLAEGQGELAKVLGGGGMFSFLNPIPIGGFRKLAEHFPGPVGEWFKEKGITLEQWKQMQGEEGAIHGGKALDYAMRAVTGYAGAGMSFLPLLGQLAGGVLYEAGAYASMGQFMGLDATGQRKYEGQDFASTAYDTLLRLFQSEHKINLEGAPGTEGSGPYP